MRLLACLRTKALCLFLSSAIESDEDACRSALVGVRDRFVGFLPRDSSLLVPFLLLLESFDSFVALGMFPGNKLFHCVEAINFYRHAVLPLSNKVCQSPAGLTCKYDISTLLSARSRSCGRHAGVRSPTYVGDAAKGVGKPTSKMLHLAWASPYICINIHIYFAVPIKNIHIYIYICTIIHT